MFAGFRIEQANFRGAVLAAGPRKATVVCLVWTCAESIVADGIAATIFVSAAFAALDALIAAAIPETTACAN